MIRQTSSAKPEHAGEDQERQQVEWRGAAVERGTERGGELEREGQPRGRDGERGAGAAGEDVQARAERLPGPTSSITIA